MKVLHGHTSPETAYVVNDYPYGFRLRCKIRYWLEKAVKGAMKGEYRLMTQTTNPKVAGEVWNKPKASTYLAFAVMYLDEQEHVHWAGLYRALWPEHWGKFVADGYYAQLNEEQRAEVDAMIAESRKLSHRSWKDWDLMVDSVRHARNVSPQSNPDQIKEMCIPIYLDTFRTIWNYLQMTEPKEKALST